MTYLVELLLSK